MGNFFSLSKFNDETVVFSDNKSNLMKIFFATIFMFCFFVLPLNAQNGSIIVTKVVGQVNYLKDQSSDKKRLIPGAKIPISGALNLHKDAKVNLLLNGKQIRLEKKGAYDLKTLAEKNDKGLSMSFAGRFWDFINDGLSQADNKDALNDYSERLLAVSGGVQGYALEETLVQTIMPVDGKIGVDLVTFNWHNINNVNAYHFKIYHADEEKLVFQALVRDTSFTLDFSQLVFLPNEKYDWKIEVEDTGAKDTGEKQPLVSTLNTFEYVSDGHKIITEKANSMSDFQSADDFEKLWMEAIIMEQEDFNYDAFSRYQYLLNKNPDNLLIIKLYAAFMVRQGLTQEAAEIIE